MIHIFPRAGSKQKNVELHSNPRKVSKYGQISDVDKIYPIKLP